MLYVEGLIVVSNNVTNIGVERKF